VEAALTRLGDAVEQRGDATRAGAMLGWTPSASFEDVVHRMVDADLARV
ncbi:MAG: hypothetical protein QOJ37_1015, partial [Pseudonocardiales bacterium]|nr:hypothetical protein [Pseudonocardiales bacterium]